MNDSLVRVLDPSFYSSREIFEEGNQYYFFNNLAFCRPRQSTFEHW